MKTTRKRARNPFPALTHWTMHENPMGCFNRNTDAERVS